jgi:hypothetical protein
MRLPFKKFCLLTASFFVCQSLLASTITGMVTDEKGSPLGFTSVTIKGTAKGAIANSQGVYVLTVNAGDYVLVCHHVGYRTVEKNVRVESEKLEVNFQLTPQELSLPEVVIKRGEDPALEIMRQAIKKRQFYNQQVDSFTVDVYIKAIVRSRAIPERFMGQKVDKKELEKQGVDSAGKGILFLSESLTKVAYKRPGKLKMEVLSSRQSGGGFGLSVPFFVNFYTNNVALFSGNLAPRGFISPLADAAFHYYRFRYEGNFFEGDKMVDRIRVTPRRKNEPLFEGFLQIVDGEWRIHSLSLTTNKQQGLDLLDTVRVTQVHGAVEGEVWRTQNQVVSFAASMFGFQMAGDFLNVYSNYDLAPGFRKKYFDRVLMKYDTAFNKRDSLYWSNLRPVPLESDERHDFLFKDSIQKWERDSMYSEKNIDSLRKAQKPVKPMQLFRRGITRNFYSTTSWKTYRFEPLLQGLQYNTVEGVSLSAQQRFHIRPKEGKKKYEIGWENRYGFTNRHLMSFAHFTIRHKDEASRNRFIQFSGGKRLLQFNRDNPIDEFSNSVASLFYRRNYLKLYEAWFGKIDFNTAFENGLRLNVTANYENRIPVENRSSFSFFYKERSFTPNHPYELAAIPFAPHAATVASFTVTYQPAQYYIDLPERKIPIGSKYPTFEAFYAKGFPGLFSSTADFDKWRFSVYDDANLKLAGTFKYRVSVGGFLNNRQVDIPDFTHFNGNQTSVNFAYLNSFQLAPYYRYSNTERFYTLLHAEHHFNGLLTNKIPLINKLKWNLVVGTNTFYVNRNNYYVEAFAGFENIFKIFRVDFVTATQAAPGRQSGIRIGFGGVIGNNISRVGR